MDVPVPEALDGPKVRLTETERRIISVFFKRGGTAKEIANFLGVAPRTVYKATYKYRLNLKALGIELSELKREIEKRPRRAQISAIEVKRSAELPGRELLLEEIRKVVRETLADIIGPQSVTVFPQVDVGGIIEQLERLEKSIGKLAESIDRLALAFSELNFKVPPPRAKNKNSDNSYIESGIPSFVQGNPWLAVLKSRGRQG